MSCFRKKALALAGHVTSQRPQIHFKFNILVFKLTNLIASTLHDSEMEINVIILRNLVLNIMRYESCSFSQQTEIPM